MEIYHKFRYLLNLFISARDFYFLLTNYVLDNKFNLKIIKIINMIYYILIHH